VSRYDDKVRAVRTKRDNEFAQKQAGAIRRLQEDGRADHRLEPWYAANALGAMVGRYAEMYMRRRGEFKFETAVEQLTLLWANAIGLKQPS
jgi:hypothetical protein